MHGADDNTEAELFFTKCIACASSSHSLVMSGSGLFKLRKTPSLILVRMPVWSWAVVPLP